LASVILQMLAIGLGDIAGFPFIEPPDPRHIRDGFCCSKNYKRLRANTAS